MKDGSTALWVACQKHQPECLALLLEAGAKVDVTRTDGLSALDVSKQTDAKYGDASCSSKVEAASLEQAKQAELTNSDAPDVVNAPKPVKGRLGNDILRLLEKDHAGILQQWLGDPSMHLEDTEAGKNQTALIWCARNG